MKWLKENRKFVITLLAVFVVMGVFAAYLPSNAYADVGNSVSHSSSFHSSSSSSSHSSSSSDGDSIMLIILLLIQHPWLIIPFGIGYAIYLLLFKRSKKEPPLEFTPPTNQDDNRRIVPQDNNLTSLKEHDPEFSEPNFVMKVNNMFLQLQNAWTAKEWKGVRPFETDELFNMHQMQLQSYINNHTSNVVDNICILNTEIIGYETDGVNDILNVMIQARFNDYVIDDNTKKLIKGNMNEEFYITYNWRMIRKKGVLTDVSKAGISADSCKSCGANMSINHSGVCEYCGSVMTKGDYDWVLSEIEVIQQR